MQSRWIRAALAVGLAVGMASAGAACTIDKKDNSDSGSHSAKASATGQLSNKEICSVIGKSIRDGSSEAARDIGESITAKKIGADQRSDDKAQAAGKRLRTMNNELRSQADRADNPQTRSTLNSVADDVSDLAKDPTSLANASGEKKLLDIPKQIAGVCS